MENDLTIKQLTYQKVPVGETQQLKVPFIPQAANAFSHETETAKKPRKKK